MSPTEADDATTIDGGATPVIPGYRDFTILGAGMTSTVWRAHQHEFDRDVAIKVLKAGSEQGEARDRFEREKKISAKLGNHPYVVAVFATGTTSDGRPYMAMDLCDQGSLADQIERSGAFTVDDVIDIGVKVADAVQAAHDKGVLHRDIKPQNIMMSEYGPALTDFGISRAAAGELTATVQHLTPVHSPPEAFLDTKPTTAMDIYALGSTLFMLLAGLPAYPRKPGETYTQYTLRLERDPIPPFRRRDVPDDLRAVIERAMAKRPEDRFASARELGQALRTIQMQRGGARAPAAPSDPTHPSGSGSTTAPGAEGTIVRPRSAVPAASSAATTAPAEPVVATKIGIGGPPGDGTKAGPGRVAPSQTVGDATVVRSRPTTEPLPLAPAHEPRGRRGVGRRVALIAGGVFLGLALMVGVVTIINPSGSGSQDDPTVVETDVDPSLAPTDLTVVRDGTTADLTWTDTAASAKFIVQWRPFDSQTWITDSSDVAQYTVSGLDASRRYCYRVTAVVSLSRSSSPTKVCPE